MRIFSCDLLRIMLSSIRPYTFNKGARPSWPTFEPTLLYYIFSKQKSTNILGFPFIACWLSIKNVRVLIALMIDDDDKKTRGSTRKWIRRREEEGMYANVVQELLVEDTRTYREMMRMIEI